MKHIQMTILYTRCLAPTIESHMNSQISMTLMRVNHPMCQMQYQNGDMAQLQHDHQHEPHRPWASHDGNGATEDRRGPPKQFSDMAQLKHDHQG